jgi:hypothetical protein
MQIAKVSGTTVLQVGDYRTLFPQTSFGPNGPTQEFLTSNSCLGVTVFKAHDKATQKLVTVAPYVESNQVFTVAVESLTTEEVTSALATEKTKRCAEVNALRDGKEVSGFMYQGKLFQSDERSAQRIVNAAMTASSLMMVSQPFSVTWLSDDDTEFNLDGAGMLALQGAFTQFAGSLHFYGRLLKDQINAATTTAAVNAIDISTGWPA